MIYIYDYNTHELVSEYNSLGRAALSMGYRYVQVILYNKDRITKGHRAAVVHRKKGIAVYITSEKIKQNIVRSRNLPYIDIEEIKRLQK